MTALIAIRDHGGGGVLSGSGVGTTVSGVGVALGGGVGAIGSGVGVGVDGGVGVTSGGCVGKIGGNVGRIGGRVGKNGVLVGMVGVTVGGSCVGVGVGPSTLMITRASTLAPSSVKATMRRVYGPGFRCAVSQTVNSPSAT
jgi:hypothetical protein